MQSIMGMGRYIWLLLPRQVRALPADLAAMAGVVLAVNIVVFVPFIRDTPLRVPFGLAFVLFVPGYALIAALFPEAGEPPTPQEDEEDEGWMMNRDRGIDGIERVALSFGLSIAVVPLIGLALNFTPWGIRLIPIMIATSGFTLVMIAIAAVRRWELPPEERFAVPYHDWLERARSEIFEPDDRVDAALNVALALSIILAVGVLSYAIMFPPEGERFSEFYVLTEDDEGELVAANYPTELIVGNSEELVVGVGNQEHETVEYTVIVQLEEVEFDRDTEGNITNVSVIDTEELERFELTLTHNETRHEYLAVGTDNTDMIGENRRLQFLLYTDHDTPVPENPTRENAYRDLHLWVDVEES